MTRIHLMAASALVSFAANKDTDATLAPDQTPAAPEIQGVRARRTIMLKNLLPADGVDWIMKNVVSQGKGTRATLGRIFGVCTGYSIKTNTLPDGTPSSSIVLHGDFETENYIDGEIGSGTTAYIPAAYSEKVKTVFDANAILNEAGEEIGNRIRTIEIDIDVGVEATGKTIPYEWVVVAFKEGAEMATLKRMRSTRARPQFVINSPTVKLEAVARPMTAPLAMLEGPSGGDVIEGEAKQVADA